MYSKVNGIIKEHFEKLQVSKSSMYLVLYDVIKQAIVSGALPEHSKMPPSRLLSDYISVSRSTVVKAYNLLTENKFLQARQGSGYVVAETKSDAKVEQNSKANYPEISETGKSFLKNIHLLGGSQNEGMAFTPGLPPLDVFPIGQWQKLTNLYWRHIKSSDLNYSISSGLYSLKKNIANYLLLTRRIQCDPDQIIIVSGSLQSLYLLGSVLINKGDEVLVENPTFPNVISIFKSLQANVNSIRVDKEGILVSDILKEGHTNTKLVHITPSNQYPLGGKMGLKRRLALLDWANETNAFIIENDYEHEINNWENHTDSVFSLDKQQRTIYLGTFNRILHPSIRLGYMIAPPYLLPAIKALQMHSHRFVPQSIQVVMTDFIGQNYIFKHIRSAIEEALERQKLFQSLYEKHFDASSQLIPGPVRSFHMLASLPDGLADKKVISAFQNKEIVAHSLSNCFVDEPKQQGLIFGYSCVNRWLLTEFLIRMAKTYDDLI